MTREEITMLGFEIVAYAGDARSKLFEAISLLQDGEFTEANELRDKAEELLILANKSQLELLKTEVEGEGSPYSFILMHGQDHLMTAVLLKDMFKVFENLYLEFKPKRGRRGKRK